jgi:hypothetical protein
MSTCFGRSVMAACLIACFAPFAAPIDRLNGAGHRFHTVRQGGSEWGRRHLQVGRSVRDRARAIAETGGSVVVLSFLSSLENTSTY